MYLSKWVNSSNFHPNKPKSHFRTKIILNPLISINVKMHALLVILHRFPMVLIRKIHIKLGNFILDDHFLYSHDLYVYSSSHTVRRNKMLVKLVNLP